MTQLDSYFHAQREIVSGAYWRLFRTHYSISVRSYKPKEITKSVLSIFVKTLKIKPFGWLNNVIQQ
jgi:hypothetical protein